MNKKQLIEKEKAIEITEKEMSYSYEDLRSDYFPTTKATILNKAIIELGGFDVFEEIEMLELLVEIEELKEKIQRLS